MNSKCYVCAVLVYFIPFAIYCICSLEDDTQGHTAAGYVSTYMINVTECRRLAGSIGIRNRLRRERHRGARVVEEENIRGGSVRGEDQVDEAVILLFREFKLNMKCTSKHVLQTHTLSEHVLTLTSPHAAPVQLIELDSIAVPLVSVPIDCSTQTPPLSLHRPVSWFVALRLR